jgi:O-antigen/teichoic acid export membrane protein
VRAPDAGSSRSGLRSLARSFLGLSAGRGIASLISAGWLIVVARHISLSDFGDLALLLALGAIFNTVSDRGLQLALAEHVASVQAIHAVVLRTVIRRRLLVAVGCAVATGVLYIAAARDRSLEIPLIFSISILSTTVYTSALTAYRALGLVAADGANEVLSRLAVLGFGTVWLLAGGGLRAVVATYALADLASAVIVSAFVQRRRVTGAAPTDPPDLGVRATAPIAFAMVTTIIYYRVDTYLVGLIKGSAPAGLYGASYRILESVLIAAAALGSLVIAHVGRPGARRLAVARRFAGLALVTTVPLVGVIGLLSRPTMRLLFGANFARAGPILAILLVSAVPGAVVAAVAPLAAISDRRRFAVLSAGILVLNVAANLAAIPLWGATGAAWSNVISQTAFAVFAWALIRSESR